MGKICFAVLLLSLSVSRSMKKQISQRLSIVMLHFINKCLVLCLRDFFGGVSSCASSFPFFELSTFLFCGVAVSVRLAADLFIVYSW